jgi:hypothetical protein
LTLPRTSQTVATCGIAYDSAPGAAHRQAHAVARPVIDRTEKSVVIGGLMELSGAEATPARALSIPGAFARDAGPFLAFDDAQRQRT